MKYVIRTVDKDDIKQILSVDNIYDNLVYDGSPSLEDFEPNTQDNLWFILKYNNNVCGLITLEYLNYILWTPHIFIYEAYRGLDSDVWGKLVVEYMVTTIGARKFLALTPYKSAKRYAEKIGFKQIAVLTKSIKKNGELLDQYVLEM